MTSKIRMVTICCVGAVMVFGIGCANLSSLQTARTLDPGTSRFTIGGGYYTSPELNEAASDAGVAEDLKLPYGELAYRRGVIDNLDIGAKLTLIGTMAVDGKYKLLDTGSLALATGLSLGYFSLTVNDTTVSTIDVIVPVFASFHLGDFAAVYASPKYLLRKFGGDATGMSHMVGATARFEE